MKIQYSMIVNIPEGDHQKALQVYTELQSAFADVLIEEGVTTEGLKMKDLSLHEPGERHA